MQITPLAIADVLLMIPTVHRDARGFFAETYVQGVLSAVGMSEPFVQDNHCLSLARHVVRGLHFQVPPVAQGKLVRVIRGSIFDVAVDLRVGSPTYGRHIAAVLSAVNWRQLWIPVGFAHGYCTLEPETEVLYKVTKPYAPGCERYLKWDDPALAIAWPIEGTDAILSSKDASAPVLAQVPSVFRYPIEGERRELESSA